MSAVPAGGPVLDLDRLSVSYRQGERELQVLGDVSLRIDAGETYGLVGESGCGKSTLAMAIVRYLGSSGRQTGGTVSVDGTDVGTLGADALREWRGTQVAMVYQEPGRALNPTMRVGEQISEVLRYHDRDAGAATGNIRTQTVELLARVAFADPEAIAERYPHELSGGQQQRIVLAMALAGRPRLLILDEPTTGLDVTVEAEVLEVVAALRDELAGAVLFISHNLALIGEVCDRVGVLYAGKLVEQGATGDVLAHPRHPYTRALLGCVPRLGTTKHDGSLRPIPGVLPVPGSLAGGCPFAPRCPLAEPACEREDPPLESVAAIDGRAPAGAGGGDTGRGDTGGGDGGHLVACRRAAETASPPETATPERTPAGPTPPEGRGAESNARTTVTSDGAARTEPSATNPPATTPPAAERADAAVPAAATEPLVSLRGVTVRYRDTVAAEAVELDIAPGEAVGLVGESGSGKTTIGRAIVGLIPLAEGRVHLDGQPLPTRIGARDRATMHRLQMVFQSPDSTLNPRLAVRTTLQRAITKLGGTRDLGDLAAAVQLSPTHLEQRPDALSGGLKQRVAIARAFAGHPDLVVCDEPVSALDVSVQAGILDLLSRLQEEERVAYLFISHDLAVTRYLADRIAVMYRGQLVEVGAAGDVFAEAHHPYTDTLLRAAPALGKRRAVVTHPPRSVEAAAGESCRFVDRCPLAVPGLCDREAPPWQDLDDGHRVRCHFGADLLAERLAPAAAGGDATAATTFDRAIG